MIFDKILDELMTPTGQAGPASAAYNRAMSGGGHALLGACAAVLIGGWGLWFGLGVAVAYWLAKERGDLTRGGGIFDGIEDALMVWIGTAYGPWWWLFLMAAVMAYIMALDAVRRLL